MTRLTLNQLATYDVLRDVATDWIVHLIHEKFGTPFEYLDEDGESRCREDITFHLSWLRPTLETGDPSPFRDYLNWVHQVQETRFGHTESLAFTIHHLGGFFARNMPEGGDAVARYLAQAASRIGDQDFQLPCEAGWPEAASFEKAILYGDRAQAIAIIEALHAQGHSMIEIDVFVIEPAMNAIGCKWQLNQISIAEEHLASTTVASAMAVCIDRLYRVKPNGKKALLACVEKNQHLLGLQMVADALEIDGWEVRFLGADTPANSLLEYMADFAPDVVGLSVVFAHQLSVARATIEKIQLARLVKQPFILLGGIAVKQYPHLFSAIGADACATDVRFIKQLEM